MGVYQYNVGQADSHWSLLGTAIKVSTASRPLWVTT